MNCYKREMPEPGQLWKHFKGNVYRIVCIAEDTENLNPVVVYQDVKDTNYWARSLWVFISEVDHKKYPEVTKKWRFERI